jgi:hypothetical protein
MLVLDMYMKKAMKGEIDLFSAAMAVQKELMGIPEFGEEDQGFLAAEKKVLQNLKKAAIMTAGAAAQKFQQKLSQEQEILMNLADMTINIYMAESALLRTEKLASLKGETAVALQIDLAKTYLNDAVDRVNTSGKNAIIAMAEGDELRMMLMGLKRFTKATPYNTKEARRRIASSLIAADQYMF